MKEYRFKKDVYKGDVIRHNGEEYTVIDTMNSNNGNFRAVSKNAGFRWFNVIHCPEIVRRSNTDCIYI